MEKSGEIWMEDFLPARKFRGEFRGKYRSKFRILRFKFRDYRKFRSAKGRCWSFFWSKRNHYPTKNHNLDSRQLSEKLIKRRCAFQTLPESLPTCECRGPATLWTHPLDVSFFAKWLAGFPKESVKPRGWKMEYFSGGKYSQAFRLQKGTRRPFSGGKWKQFSGGKWTFSGHPHGESRDAPDQHWRCTKWGGPISNVQGPWNT